MNVNDRRGLGRDRRKSGGDRRGLEGDRREPGSGSEPVGQEPEPQDPVAQELVAHPTPELSVAPATVADEIVADEVGAFGLGSASAGQSGDTQGLSTIRDAGPSSVEELVEAGQSYEAGILLGVEDAADHPEQPVRVHKPAGS